MTHPKSGSYSVRRYPHGEDRVEDMYINGKLAGKEVTKPNGDKIKITIPSNEVVCRNSAGFLCPDCLTPCPPEELKMFSGLCEECNSQYNKD